MGLRKVRQKLISAACMLMLTGLAYAQTAPEPVLKVEPLVSVDKIRAGDTFEFGLRITFLKDWHANSHTPSEDYLVPTVLEFSPSDDFEFGDVAYPPAQQKKFAFSETPVSVYTGVIVLRAKVTAAASLRPGRTIIAGKLSYQACNDLTCRIPTSAPFQLELDVADASTPVERINAHVFDTSTPGGLAELAGERSDESGAIGDMFSGNGLLLTLLFIFVGGLALNLTPCVYPIIPITISFFVGQASGKISKSFFLALVYVLGMSITYSVLGVVAAMTGGLLGASLQNPIVLIIIAGVFLIFASSMFGAFDIRVPSSLNRLAGGSKQGLFGSFFMGLTVGIVAAPCIGPFVISLLTYVAAKGDPLTGFTLFFILSMGLGLPYLILGTFSGSIKNLPHSGEWMNWVKKVFGIIMIAVAIYFVQPLLPNTLSVILLSATLIVGGVWVGLVDKTTAGFAWFRMLKTVVGMALVAYGAWFATSAWTDARADKIAWQAYDAMLLQQASADGKPVIIDFFADWCIPCKQLDKTLFTAESVVAKAKTFVALKADLSRENSDEVKTLRRKYNVLGVPTIILIDPAGNEYKRFTDELVKFTPEEFVAEMTAALNRGTN